MKLQDILSYMTMFVENNSSDSYMQFQYEDVLRLVDYIDNLEDKNQILYMVLGGKNEEKSI